MIITKQGSTVTNKNKMHLTFLKKCLQFPTLSCTTFSSKMTNKRKRREKKHIQKEFDPIIFCDCLFLNNILEELIM